jgi:excinuclease ABC subunit C
MHAYESTATLPAAPGVYRFRDERGRVLYIGRAASLRSRVRSYWRDVGDRPHLRRMVPRIDRVEAVVCRSRHEATWLERNLLEHRMPPWNRTPGGQEVPVWLRLSADDVHVVHERTGGDPHFGPYLGGLQVRLAAAGLRRIYPLRYANDRLTSAERDLARVRGIAVGDRMALHASVAGVLGRDDGAVAAVHNALVDRRTAATGRFAYELAASIQAEIEALAWISQPQQVTGDEADADVFGFSDGVLVRFELRRGRVRDWRVSLCSANGAAPKLAASPLAWREFAAENARIAAALRSSTVSSPTAPGSSRRRT